MTALIDTDFDFTQDTESYWKYWWTAEKGDELTGSRCVSDPDSQSKTLNEYHKILWNKQLPDGRLWDLKPKKGRGYYFEWNDGIKPRYYSSDSLLNSFRWTDMKPVLKQVKNHVERELKEETGAVDFTIKPVCAYSVKGKTRVNENADDETFGMLFVADIFSFEEIHSEIEKIILTDELVDNWTYPLIQPKLIQEAQKRGFV